MNLPAVNHRPTQEFIYPASRNELILQLFTAAKDIDEVTLLYWERYEQDIDYSTDRGSLERQLIRVAMASVGDTVIIPIQDWLELGSEARINQPSTLGCNWLWRMNAGACTSALANEIAQMTELYGR